MPRAHPGRWAWTSIGMTTVGACIFVIAVVLELRGDTASVPLMRLVAAIVISTALLIHNPKSTLYRVLAAVVVGSGMLVLVLRLKCGA